MVLLSESHGKLNMCRPRTAFCISTEPDFFGESQLVNGDLSGQQLGEMALDEETDSEDVKRLEIYPQGPFKDLGHQGAVVSAHGLDPLCIEGGQELSRFSEGETGVTLLIDKNTRMIDLFKLKLDGCWIAPGHGFSDLFAQDESLFFGSARKVDKHRVSITIHNFDIRPGGLDEPDGALQGLTGSLNNAIRQIDARHPP